MQVRFLVFVAMLVGAGFWELNHALSSTREIKLPVVPVGVGGAALYALGILARAARGRRARSG